MPCSTAEGFVWNRHSARKRHPNRLGEPSPLTPTAHTCERCYLPFLSGISK